MLDRLRTQIGYFLNYVRNKHLRLSLLNLGSGVVFLVAIYNDANPLYGAAINTLPTRLQDQTAALLVESQGQLAGLESAPYYAIEATLSPETGVVEGQVKLTYTHPGPAPVKELVFRLLPNARSIYGGGSLEVTAARSGKDNLKLIISDDRTILYVRLWRELKKDEVIEVTLDFTAQAPHSRQYGYGIFNHDRKEVTLAGWYPILAPYQQGWVIPPVPRVGDALLADTSLYEVILHTPPGYKLASTGVITKIVEDKEKVTWHFVSGPAREFALAASRYFIITETKVEGTTLRLYTLPADSAINTEKEGMKMLQESFQAYLDRFGPYPFTELDVVEASITIDGYEFSGMVFIDDHLRTKEREADYRYIMAHEVAHQWWYGLTGNNTVDEPWLDEAFATYSAVISYEHTRGTGAGNGLLAYWRGSYGRRTPQEPAVNSSARDFRSWADYREAIYIHGALFLHDLRQEMGDEAFFQLLQVYQSQNRYVISDAQDFFQLAEVIYGEDLTPLINVWFK